jgi:hypothetical protein
MQTEALGAAWLSTDPWSTLLGVIVGAAISLVTTWWVGPKIARRQRREKRREKSLAKLRKCAVLQLDRLVFRILLYCEWIVSYADTGDWRHRLEEAHSIRDSKAREAAEEALMDASPDIARILTEIQPLMRELIIAQEPAPIWIAEINDKALAQSWHAFKRGLSPLEDLSWLGIFGVKFVDLVIEREEATKQAMEAFKTRPLELLGLAVDQEDGRLKSLPLPEEQMSASATTQLTRAGWRTGLRKTVERYARWRRPV